MKLNLTQQKKGLNKIYYFIAFLLFYFFISFNTPLTGDDWTWGTDRGLLRLETRFEDYNGRYISNLLEILLTRYDWLRYITVATFSSLLVFMVGRLTSYDNNKVNYMLSFILFLLIPTSIFSQTFGWTAGFVNYVPSLVLLLAYLIIVKNIFLTPIPIYSNWLQWLIVPLGIISQLFVEHVTLFSIFTALSVIAYTFYKHKRFYALHITYLISVVIGSLIMFSNSAYRNVVSGSDDYRSINKGGEETFNLLERIYSAYSGKMYNYLFIDNLAINLFLGIMVVILIVYFISNSNWINFVIKPILIFIITSFLLYIIFFRSMLGIDFLNTKTNDFEAIFSIFYFLSIILSISLFIKDRDSKTRLYFYLSGIVLLTAPFVFVTPYGPRASLGSFVFMVLLGLELFSYNKETLSWSIKNFTIPAISTVLVLVIGYTFVFTTIGVSNRERLSQLNAGVERADEVIYLRELPFSHFMWMSSPPRKHFNTMFKRFYKVPKNTEVNFIPHNEWKEKQLD